MSSLRPRPKADAKVTLAAERAAARATRRQELARIIAEKQQQMARVKACNAGQSSDDGYHQNKDGLRQASSVSSGTSADGDRSTNSRPLRNKENQMPVTGSLQAAYQSRRTASKVAPVSCQTGERRPSDEKTQKRATGVSAVQKKSSDCDHRDTPHGIEDQYSFDLAKVEEMLKKETSEDMEEMYSFDLSKLSKVDDAAVQQVANQIGEATFPEELPMRSRRKSAPMPGEAPKDTCSRDEKVGEHWQEAGMRQLAAENRELRERAARLESEFKRLHSLASVMPSFDAEALQFAEMD